MLTLGLLVALGVATTLYLTRSLHRAPYHQIYVIQERDGSIEVRTSERGHGPACGKETVKRYWRPYRPLQSQILCVHDLVDDAEFASKSARLHWVVFADAVRTNAQFLFPLLISALAGLLTATAGFLMRHLTIWIRSAPDSE